MHCHFHCRRFPQLGGQSHTPEPSSESSGMESSSSVGVWDSAVIPSGFPDVDVLYLRVVGMLTLRVIDSSDEALRMYGD